MSFKIEMETVFVEEIGTEEEEKEKANG